MAARLPLSRHRWRVALLAFASMLARVSPGAPADLPTAAEDELPMRPTRPFEFDTDEATWLSVSLSPDGRAMVFDLLGALYRLPATGGAATPITHGPAFNGQPSYSPDGAWIAFTSDRSGAENVWIAHLDGSGARRISDNDGPDEFVSPAWSPDGRYLYASRYRADRNAVELWRFAVSADDPPRELTNGRRSALGAAPSPDGRFLYYAACTGSLFEDDVTLPLWSIERLELSTGAVQTVVTNEGSAMRPVLSNDGRTLAYASRIGRATGLRLRELASGKDRLLAYPIQRDVQEALPSRDLVPGYAFTSDGAAVVIAIDGKLRRIDVASAQSSPLTFTAHVAGALGPATRRELVDPTGPVHARLIQHPVESPDGRRLAFTALGEVHVMELARGHATRLTRGDSIEAEAAWSPDGKRIAYVTWSAHDGGQVWSAPSDGSGPPRPESEPGSFYTNPAFRPDGQAILALRSSAYERLHTFKEPALWLKRSFGSLRQADLVEVAAGRPPRTVASGVFGGAPQFSRADPRSVFLNSENGLEAIALDGSARRTVLAVVGPGYYFIDGAVAADDIELSPDGRHALALVGGQLHLLDIAGLDGPAKPIDVRHGGTSHRQLTNGGADYAGWTADGRSVAWSTGSTYWRRPVGRIVRDSSGGASAERPVTGHDGIEAFATDVSVARDAPRGVLVLRGATAITMGAPEVVEDADVVVVDNRIAAVGKRGSVRVPDGATIRDVSGRTIVPGFIDVHDHFGDVRREVLDRDAWGFAATLAYGVTGALDPSTLTVDMLAYQDLLDAGRLIGPRLYSTGTALFSFYELDSQQRADDVVERYARDYRLSNLKEYRSGSRRARQWVAMAARRFGLLPTTEGALDLKLDLTQVLDGFAGNEHALAATPLGRDVIELMVRARVSYTPTLMISHGGPPTGEEYIARLDPLDDPKIAWFYPRFAREHLFSRVHWTAPDEHAWPLVAADAARIQRAGGLVAVGSHGNYPGIGYHWEMQALADGGMSAPEVLRAATLGSAETIGRIRDLGSLEPGKYADLVVLDRNPWADIRAAQSVHEVMKNGRLYDAATLAEEWPEAKAPPAAWFRGEPPTLLPR